MERGVCQFLPYRANPMKAIIIGGVAGGATAAARLRRNSESAQIILVERGPYRNCS